MTSNGSCPICDNYISDIEQKYNKYNLVKCVFCDMVYSSPHRSDINIYENSYKEQINSYGSYEIDQKIIMNNINLTWAQYQLKKYFNIKSGKFLDVGCSTGMFISAFNKTGLNGFGIEPSQAAVESIPSSIQKNVICGVLESDSFSKGFFDLVTAWEVIEHLEDPGEFLQNVKRILKKDGTLALSCPNWNSPWEKTTTDINRRPPFHLNYFTEKTLPKLLKKHGFKITVNKCKPIPWSEELGRLKWILLPYSLVQSFLLNIKPNRLFIIAKLETDG